MKAIGRGLTLFFATGAGTGYIPRLPGTAGSAAGVAVYLLLCSCSPGLYLAITIALTAAAIRLSAAAARLLQKSDPPQVVIDEIAGFLVTMIGLPPLWQYVAAGFVLFRALDILKPYPANLINDRMHGGAGIVLDDIVAGVYANLILQAVRFILS
jgi:phosphatidylglycerophosphatase A